MDRQMDVIIALVTAIRADQGFLLELLRLGGVDLTRFGG